jgi:radical SAM protein with 4Fe4S-binding SPASM domain
MTPLLQRIYFTCFPGPRSVKIHVNYDCNYRCVYCYSNRKNGPALSTQQWLHVIDDLRKYSVQTVEISGGEPFLHNDLLSIVKKCADNGYGITIYTNGSLIDDDWTERLRSLKTPVILAVKYDALGAYARNTRTKHSLRKVEGNIRMAVLAGIPVVAFITVTKQNVKYLRQIISRALTLGAFPLVERYVPARDKKTNSHLNIGSKDWLLALGLIREVYREYSSLIDGVARIQGRTCSCYATQFSIMQNGDVLPCQFLPQSVRIGNITADTLADIWSNLKAMRSSALNIPDDCLQCSNKRSCRGGCRTSSFYAYGTFSRKDPLCVGQHPSTSFALIHQFYPHIDRIILNPIGGQR